jgi:hypothetical protein
LAIRERKRLLASGEIRSFHDLNRPYLQKALARFREAYRARPAVERALASEGF